MVIEPLHQEGWKKPSKQSIMAGKRSKRNPIMNPCKEINGKGAWIGERRRPTQGSGKEKSEGRPKNEMTGAA